MPVSAKIARTHHTRPAKRLSCSTSCGAGVRPSEPRAPASSNNDAPTARATAQAKIEPHLSRQACSERLRMRGVSPLAVAFAGCEKKYPGLLRWPTQPTELSRFDPTSSGYVRSFLRRAVAKATTSIRAALLRASPSDRNALTNVVWTANCAPPCRGRPSVHAPLQASDAGLSL